MSRKVNPLSLRLGHSKTWDSSWFATRKHKTKSYAEQLHRDLEIRRLLQFFFEEKSGIFVGFIGIHTSCQLISDKMQGERRSYTSWEKEKGHVYHIHVILHSVGSKVDYRLAKDLLHKAFPECAFMLYIEDYAMGQDRNNLLKTLESSHGRSNMRGVQMDSLLCLFVASLESGKSKFLCDALKSQLERTPMHLSILDAMDRVLETAYEMGEFQGCKIQLKGRLNGSERSRLEQIQHGRVPLQTLSAPIDHSMGEFHTPFGVCSIRVWFYV
jgi:hypothetical protein